MLKFILGTAGSGKTYEIFKRMKAKLLSGEKVMLIVPEQFTYECEREMLSSIGAQSTDMLEILSLTSLCERIKHEFGGGASEVVDETSRLLLMSSAIKSQKDNLKIYGKYVKSVEFARETVNAVNEFKRCAVNAEQLKELSEKTDGALAEKLYDISVIMKAYDAIIANRFLDPMNEIDLCLELIKGKKYFNGVNVFFDSFRAFFDNQLYLIEKIISEANEVTFALAVDSEKRNVFKNIEHTKEQIEALARKYSVKIEAPMYLPFGYSKNDTMKAIEKITRTGAIGEEESNNVHFIKAKDRRAETEATIAEIKRLVITKGYRYRDFLIVCRDEGSYSAFIESSANKCGVPVFIDRKRRLDEMPLSVYIMSAIKAARSFNIDSILAMLKTGISDFSPEEIARLENYTYIWSISGDEFKNEWTKNPEGFDSRQTEQSPEKLKKLNSTREKITKNLSKLKDGLNGSVRDMAEAIYSFIVDTDIPKSLKKYSEKLLSMGKVADSDLQAASYKSVMNILDKLVTCVADNISADELENYLALMFNAVSIAGVPATLDEVLFGEADRIRPMRPKVVFVLGANISEFPKIPSSSGIFTVNDRTKMINLGVGMQNKSQSAADEEYLFYTSVTASSDMLYLSFHADVSDSVADFSRPAKLIADSFKASEITVIPKDETDVESVVSPMQGVEVFAEHINLLDENTESLKAALLKSETAKLTEKILAAQIGVKHKLNEKIADKFYDSNMYLSASRIDKYFHCKYSYFLNYGLGLKTIQKAQMDALIKGSIVHYVMEHTVTDKGIEPTPDNEAELRKRIDEIMIDYLHSKNITDNELDSRFDYMKKCIADATFDLLCVIDREIKQSGFRVVEREMEIGKKSGNAYYISDDSGSASINGSIDRVDAYIDENGKKYVRVVDYKTGIKNFNMTELLYGINLQMFIYLSALLKTDKYKDYLPAGVLYQKAERPKSNNTGYKNEWKMFGVVANDPIALAAMEEKQEGKFIPVKLKNDGNPTATSSIIEPEDFDDVFSFIDEQILSVKNGLKSGKINAEPYDSDTCKYCYYKTGCLVKGCAEKNMQFKNKEVIEMMREGKNLD